MPKHLDLMQPSMKRSRGASLRSISADVAISEFMLLGIYFLSQKEINSAVCLFVFELLVRLKWKI